MAATQIAKVSIKHDAILDYLLTHADEKLGNVAVHFGVSQAWLSVIIHSDAFQTRLKEKGDDMFGAVVVPLREKLLGVAHVGVDKLGEAMEHASAVSDRQFIADTTDSLLKNLGYSPKSAAPTPSAVQQQNNFFVVDKDALAGARAKMRTVPSGDLLEGDVLEPTEGTTSEEV